MRIAIWLLSFWLALTPSWADGIQIPWPPIGQIPGTATNDNACAGCIGEYVIASTAETGQNQTTATVTITIASPGVVTWGTTVPYVKAINNIGTCAVVNFTTTGALPTGLVAGTNYYVIGQSISGNTFQVATTCANAIAGTAINTSGSQSGTQTGSPTGILATGTIIDMAGMGLTAGQWDVSGNVTFLTGAATSITRLRGSASTTSATADTTPTRNVQTSTVANVPGVANWGITFGPGRFLLSATTNVFCTSDATFTVSTLASWGGCRALRVR